MQENIETLEACDKMRDTALEIAKFHISVCHGPLLEKALAVARAICDYANEIEK